MREGTASRVMVANRPHGEFYDFYSISPEYFGYHHIYFAKVLQTNTLCSMENIAQTLTYSVWDNSWGSVSCLSKEKMMQLPADLSEVAYIPLCLGNRLKILSLVVLVCN
jgi:hypothetical protein